MVPIPIFDPATKEFLEYKPRPMVHRDGDWHWGVQAYLVRLNDTGEIEVLLQKRSSRVDIAPGKLDQSLAVQMTHLDNLDIVQALRRGLKQELGIDLDHQRYTRIFNSCDLRITKKYSRHPDVLNREFLSLFLIEADQTSFVFDESKIDEVRWMKWNDMFDWQRKEPFRFTKTSRFYFFDYFLGKQINKTVRNFLINQPLPETHIDLPAKVHYFSHGNSPYDISVYAYGDQQFEELTIYDTSKNFLLKGVKEGKFSQFESDIDALYSEAFKNSLS